VKIANAQQPIIADAKVKKRNKVVAADQLHHVK
jgi:hypothetical protein